ncbi:MAG TPA: FkbM family methyltransferase [Candidatus Acidoferrales bacterium]
MLAEYVPQNLKTAWRGEHGAPNRFANVVHGLLNRLPVERYPVLSCGGRLKGYRMRVDWNIHRAFVYDSWEPEVTQAIDERAANGMIAVDIGAQSGFYTLLLSKRVGASGKVIAFEPLPANFRMLEENIRLNKIENVMMRREAVADRSGEISFHFPVEEASLLAGPLLPEEGREDFFVNCISLDDFVAQENLRPDLIKMDVEGAEGSVVEGALRTIREFHPVLIIELHGVGEQPRQHPVPIRLQALGYSIRWLTEGLGSSHIMASWPA